MALSFTWLGHSTFIFESDNHKFMIDPFITNNPLIDMAVADVDVAYILLTHAHGDHVGFTDDSPAGDTIAIAKNTGAKIICNFEIGNWFMSKGGIPAEQILQGNPGGTIRGDWMDVKFTQAFHSSSFGDGSYGGQPNGLIIRIGGKTVYHAGDTNLFGDMALIGEEGLTLACLPIGDTYTMGVEDSVTATKLLRPQHVFPIHYNTWPPLVQDVTAWAENINRDTTAQPIVIDPGKTHTLE
ncbi:MAG: metal-dependent hydrolase [Anaerolineae bacterium]|nr:metal-dependent hydrolase [Anaerolineae bacterium]